MFAETKSEKINDTNIFVDFLRGLIVSILISLGLVIAFALAFKWFEIPEKLILPATFIIKYLSVIIGSIIAVKGTSKGLVKGGIFGALYTALAFTVFSFLSKSFSVDLTTLLDLASSVILGAIVGIIKVNKNN